MGSTTSNTPIRHVHVHVQGQWHSWPHLPRPWIVLPPDVRQAALSRPLSRHLFPSHVGFFPEAREHRVRRDVGIGSTIFKYCVRGAGWCELEGRRFEVGPGDLLVVPQGLAHAYGTDPDRPWTLHWVHAMGDEVPHILRELGVDGRNPVVRLGQSPALVGLFEEVHQELEGACAPDNVLFASQLLTHLMGVVIRLRREALRETPDARQRVLASAAYMRHHPERTRDLGTLASIAGLSPSHYSALFRAATGHSPKQYFIRVQMARAEQLLSTGSDSVKAIAHRLGFDDPLHFSRVFRRANGMAPSEFRRLNKIR
jgi:AraC family transcriptional regulator of arabinose operon